jgi:Asp-tRNA(Asn)/Glu-tRNA(Gln) amidotransferase A subunit family amidase
VVAQAREAEKAILRGDELGPLHGVPGSIKSAIDVAGHPGEAGTRLRAGHSDGESALRTAIRVRFFRRVQCALLRVLILPG